MGNFSPAIYVTSHNISFTTLNDIQKVVLVLIPLHAPRGDIRYETYNVNMKYGIIARAADNSEAQLRYLRVNRAGALGTEYPMIK